MAGRLKPGPAGADLGRVRRLLLPCILALCATAALPAPAGAMASHVGWPEVDGMLLMNKTDRPRPLDARPGRDPFAGQDRLYRCDSIHKHSDSCFKRLVPVLPQDAPGPLPLPPLPAIPGLPAAPLRVPAVRDAAAARPRDAREAVEMGLSLIVTGRPGHNKLLGGHGDDVIHAADWGDVIWGDYKPSGQPTSQRDQLYGGAGPDFIYASHGRNAIVAGDGMDIIHGHFGHGTIDCGAGRDVVYVKRRHQYKLRHCEVVSRKTGESAPGWALRKLPWR